MKKHPTLMNFHDLAVKRRSIRRYTDEPVSPEDLKLILEAALMSPTSKGARSWTFTVVDDKQMLEHLSHCRTSGAGPVAGCAVAIVVATDQTKSDPWIEDASIAATFIQLQATDLGLGSCWIQVRGRYGGDDLSAEEYVQDAIGLPENIVPECIVTIGHPAEERKPQNIEKLEWEKVRVL